MEARILENTNEWEEFVLQQKYTLFLQSPAYISFNKSQGDEAYIVGLFENGKLIGGSLVIGVKAKRGNFLTLPYGPILDFSNKDQVTTFFNFLKKKAKETGYSFIRTSPFENETKDILDVFKSIGAKKSPIHILAENTWILDTTEDLDSILKNMNKNHRNLIRRCERDGVKVTMSTDENVLDRLNDMTDEVAKRHKFHRFSRSFVSGEMKTYADSGEAVIFEATLPDGRVDASAMFIFYGNLAAYRHSASLNLDKRLPSSYLIQWNAIQEAKKRGIRWYNFWGIAPEGADKSHPFYGITHFKKGFGGASKNLVPCQDIPVSPKYYVTRAFEIVRSIRRGFK